MITEALDEINALTDKEPTLHPEELPQDDEVCPVEKVEDPAERISLEPITNLNLEVEFEEVSSKGLANVLQSCSEEPDPSRIIDSIIESLPSKKVGNVLTGQGFKYLHERWFNSGKSQVKDGDEEDEAPVNVPAVAPLVTELKRGAIILVTADCIKLLLFIRKVMGKT